MLFLLNIKMYHSICRPALSSMSVTGTQPDKVASCRGEINVKLTKQCM